MAKKVSREGAESLSTRTRLGNKEYEKGLFRLHVELVKLQRWVQLTGAKVCIIFEGRDGAGKGGTIKAITERVSPRVFRVVALPAPTERERTQMYVQRYFPHMPAGGENGLELLWQDREWATANQGVTPQSVRAARWDLPDLRHFPQCRLHHPRHPVQVGGSQIPQQLRRLNRCGADIKHAKARFGVP